MRTLLWMVVLICGYVWVISSGHDEFLFKQVKMVYEAILTWFEDAEIDFQLDRN